MSENFEPSQEERVDPLLVARILNTVAFQDPNSKVTTKTMELVSEYVRLYTTEAILRANLERLDEKRTAANSYDTDVALLDDPSNNNVDGNDGVLDTRHLEKIAGLLNLDF